MSDDIVRPASVFQARYLQNNAKILVVGGAAYVTSGRFKLL